MTVTIRRVLVPVDFSIHSDSAVEYAATIASRFGAALELLHIVDDPFVSGAWSSEVYVPSFSDLQQSLTADAEQRLATLRTMIARDHGIPVLATVRSCPVGTAIVDYARVAEVDLIALGTHGRTGLAHLVMGSVAERVVRTAHCPVLTVRQPVAAAGERASVPS